jgi:protein-S-isoprenylcysteine O-methyltransferase Ste14
MFLLCAGRVNGAMKAYLFVFAGMGLAIALVTDSSQDNERRKPGPSEIHPGSRVAASILFFATVLTAALDIGRVHWIQPVSEPAQITGLAVLISAAGLQVRAMAANSFFSTAIRIQTDRGHRLEIHGPYRLIRHPGYLAMMITMPAAAVALCSLAAIIPALGYSGLILWRTKREDEFLAEQLAGYGEYALQVRYRLIPLFW